ncbi:MAG: tungsten cofactor oxidoreductase radical SAM maturase [Bacillota bacterium]
MKKLAGLPGRKSFKSGIRVKLTEECLKNLPLDVNGGGEALVVAGEEGYRIIPLKSDIKKLYIEPTTLCNFQCITCIRSSWGDDLTHMSQGTFNRIAESLSSFPNLEWVHFGGFGEPFTHPEIFEMIRVVKEAGLKAEIITNGSFLTNETVDRLIDLKVDMIYVSLDAPDKEEYDRIRQGANFSSVLQNVTALVERRESLKSAFPQLGVEFVAMKSNYHRIPELIRLSRSLKAKKVIITNLLPYHESMQDQVLYDMDDTINLFGNDSPLSMMIAQFPYMKLRTDRYCKFVEDKAVCINHKGNVSPCYALMHSYSCYVYGRKKDITHYSLGNVNDKPLEEIWTGLEYVNFRLAVKNFKFPSCPDCKYLEGCSMTESNEMDCWGNSPSCAECLWSRQLIACP